MRDVPIFARPLGLADLEARLQALYDPYYATLEDLLGELREASGYAMLLDGHTGSPRRMKDHQVIIGTRHASTCAPELAGAVAAIFTRHGFEVHDNVSRLHRRQHRGHVRPAAGPARPRPPDRGQRVTPDDDEPRRVHRPRVARRAFPRRRSDNIARVRECLAEVVSILPAVLAAMHGDAGPGASRQAR